MCKEISFIKRPNLQKILNFFCEVFFMQMSRPLDTLNRARDKRVITELKNGRQYIGKLKAFDIHINVVLEDVEERIDGEVKRKMNSVFLRGDTITIITSE